MKLQLLVPGKTQPDYFAEALQFYSGRILQYIPFRVIEAQQPKVSGKAHPEQVNEQEARFLQKYISPRDHLVTLDERGKEYTSKQFAAKIEQLVSHTSGNIIFLAGGAWGIDKSLKERANESVALSKMTLPHQFVRVFFAEQLYRGLTILNNHPYHH